MNNTTPPALRDWDGSIGGARRLQTQLARQVVLEDRLEVAPRLIAGLDVGFEDEDRITRAAAVMLDADTLQPLESHVARVPTSMPYVPGLLSFRELPALLQALALFSRPPQLLFVDGHGIAHPRGLGIAAHLGVVTGLPSIGVAKRRLYGRHEAPGPARGDRMPLLHGATVIGCVLRSKARCNPLFVSPGHRLSITSATDWVMRCLTRYRLPEPTRLADRLASRRGAMPAMDLLTDPPR